MAPREARRELPVFVVTGTWSGYTSSQERVCHREYCGKKTAEAIRKIGHGIRFTDGTMLYLTVIKVARRTLPPLDGYSSLIRECVAQGTNEVAKLPTRPPASGTSGPRA
jgi:hypothetical protein